MGNFSSLFWTKVLFFEWNYAFVSIVIMYSVCIHYVLATFIGTRIGYQIQTPFSWNPKGIRVIVCNMIHFIETNKINFIYNRLQFQMIDHKSINLRINVPMKSIWKWTKTSFWNFLCFLIEIFDENRRNAQTNGRKKWESDKEEKKIIHFHSQRPVFRRIPLFPYPWRTHIYSWYYAFFWFSRKESAFVVHLRLDEICVYVWLSSSLVPFECFNRVR